MSNKKNDMNNPNTSEPNQRAIGEVSRTPLALPQRCSQNSRGNSLRYRRQIAKSGANCDSVSDLFHVGLWSYILARPMCAQWRFDLRRTSAKSGAAAESVLAIWRIWASDARGCTGVGTATKSEYCQRQIRSFRQTHFTRNKPNLEGTNCTKQSRVSLKHNKKLWIINWSN